MATSDLNKRMKDYEKRNRYYLQRRMPVIVRLDMRAGHTFLKNFERPFDESFIKSMQETAKYLCENIPNCKLSYQQSDEISLLLVDYEKLDTSSFLDYRTDKLCSLTASMATLLFNRKLGKNVSEFIYNNGENYETDSKEYTLCRVYKDAFNKGAIFDSRCFNLSKEEVTNYFYWRQLDASRNSIQMTGQAYFSHEELKHKTRKDIQDMLVLQKGINWNDLPTYQKRGSCCVKEKYFVPYENGNQIKLPEGCSDPFTDDEIETGIYKTHWIIDKEIPIFRNDGREYIEKFVYSESEM